jgi:hypothetical protein
MPEIICEQQPVRTFGPLSNGGGWCDTIEGCNFAESMVLAFANKLEIWAEYALS